MKEKDFGSSRSRARARSGENSTRWGKPGKCYGSELTDNMGLPLNISVSVPQRVMASSILSIKGLTFPKDGSKMLGTTYGTHLLSLFRLYMEKNDSHDTLFPIIWLDMTASYVSPGRGVGFAEDLYICGNEFLSPAWICRLLSIHGMFYYGSDIPTPTI